MPRWCDRSASVSSTPAEIEALIGEDDKLVGSLIDAGIPIPAATVWLPVYRLDGFSNGIGVESTGPGARVMK